MGCDIHLHVEIKIEDQWHHYAKLYAERNYMMFEKMAGVRGDVKEALAPPRGIPSDVAQLTRMSYEYDGIDAHTPSWLDASEIRQLYEFYKKESEENGLVWPYNNFDYGWLKSYLFGNSYGCWSKGEDGYPKWIEDLRFVFWFDN